MTKCLKQLCFILESSILCEFKDQMLNDLKFVNQIRLFIFFLTNPLTHHIGEKYSR